jgi:hypothetical protein
LTVIIGVADFIDNLPRAFEEMVKRNISLQHALNGLMKNGEKDAYT